MPRRKGERPVDQEEDLEYPSQKSAHLSLTVSEGSVEISVERLIKADTEEHLREQVSIASRSMLSAIPMDDVKKTSAKINETDENLKEPHPVVVALVRENSKMVKELATLNASVTALCERLGAEP